jgi:hypothetical protein
MIDNFGKKITFQRLGDDTIKKLTSIWKYSQKQKKESFTIEDVVTFMAKSIRMRKTKKNICRVRTLLDNLAKKDAIGKLTENANKHNPQVYFFKSNDWRYTKQEIQIGKVFAPAPVVKKKKRLTVADALNLNDMDLGFIGYTIRTELDILNRQRDTFEAENKNLKARVTYLEKQTNTAPYEVKIGDLKMQIEKMKGDHRKEIRAEQDDKKNLNAKILQLNRDVDDLTLSNSKLNKALDREKEKNSGFTVGELNTGKRPPHLNPSS